MEQKMTCPHCGRCIGFVQSTDVENSSFSITKNKPNNVGTKERFLHYTCKRCKEEVYILFGWKF